MFAGPSLFLANNCAAIFAGRSVPVVELHIGSARRVGIEQPAHHHKKIIQSAGVESRANGFASVPFAQIFVADMRVRYALVARGGPRIESHNVIRAARTAGIQLQADLESSKVHTVELDRLGRDA